MTRAMSIINDGLDIASYNSHYGEWFKDGDLLPMDLEWGRGQTHFTTHFTATKGRDLNVVSSLLHKLRWLIKTPPSSARFYPEGSQPIQHIPYKKGGLWYSYTFDNERGGKVLCENIMADPLTGVPIVDRIAQASADMINRRIKTFDICQRKAIRNAQRNAQYAQYMMNRALPAPVPPPFPTSTSTSIEQRIEQSRTRAHHASYGPHPQQWRLVDPMQNFNNRLNALPQPSIKSIDCNECPICMEPLGQTNICVLRCGHKTCGDCLFHHFQSAGGTACPMCRQDFAVRVPGWIPPEKRHAQQRWERQVIVNDVS